MLDTIPVNLRIIIVAAIVIVIILIIALITAIIRNKSLKQSNKVVVDYTYLNNLLKALGDSNNILDVSIENKRIRLMLKDIKLVDATQLKALDIPAFLKGKELKILIKDSPNEVYKFLDERSSINE